jgi:hypothetical protein
VDQSIEVTFLLRLHLSSKNTFFFTTFILARDSLKGRGEEEGVMSTEGKRKRERKRESYPPSPLAPVR